jgi:thiopurine S-methyltransferase
MMNEQFWHDRWKSNQIAFHKAEANPLLVRNFPALKPQTDSIVFVPLCGKSRDLHWLAEQGYRVVGAELSRLAVEQFFEQLGETPRVSSVGSLQRYETERISIFQGSIFELTAEIIGPVDYVYDRGALVALPQEIRDRYAAHLRALTFAAEQLLICYEYDQACADGPPFSVTEHEVRRLYQDAYDLRLLEQEKVEGGLKGRCSAIESVWKLRPR